jgi:hypothetical protein
MPKNTSPKYKENATMRREKAPTKGKYNIHWWTRSIVWQHVKERKIQKDKVQFVKERNTKIQDAFLEVMKKQKNARCSFY